MESLPVELIREIQSYLPNREFGSFRRTAKRYNIPLPEAERLYRLYHGKELEDLAKFGDLVGIYYLVENGADIHKDNNVAFKVACLHGHLDVVQFLVEKGARINANALQLPSIMGYLKIVRYLVEKGADIRANNDWALQKSCYYGRLEVVRYLVENGANIHVHDNFPLHCASLAGHLKIVCYLVECGADIHARQDFALQLASENGHSDIVSYLSEQD